ncbi:YCF48-related protein [Myxococcota bacterium]|nr:YCF48-related protein [Myxococcota bacterium]
MVAQQFNWRRFVQTSLCFAALAALPFLSVFAACPGPNPDEEVIKEADTWRPEGGEIIPEPTSETSIEQNAEQTNTRYPYSFTRVNVGDAKALSHMVSTSAVQIVGGESIFLTEDKSVWLDIAPPALVGSVKHLSIRESRVLAVGGEEATPFQGQIMLSKDTGRTWTSVWTGKKDQKDARLRAVVWITDTVAVAAGRSGQFYRTVDRGETWSPLAVGASMTNAQLEGMVLVGSKIFVVGDQGGIFLTEDNGAAWKVLQQESSLPTLRDIHFLQDKLIGYAVGTQGAVYRTTDGGATWTRYQQIPLPSNDDDLRAISSDGANRMAIVSRKYYYISLNKGNSWERFDFQEGFLPERSELRGLHFADKDNLFFLASDGHILKGVYQP